MSKKLLVSICFIIVAVSWAKPKKEESSFPEYDFSSLEKRVISAEEKSQMVSEDISFITTKVLKNSDELIHVSSRVSQVSPARLEELEIQLALLTEAFRDLYDQVAAIKVLPQIKYAKKIPTKPTGFTVSNSSKLLGGDEFALYSRGLDSYRKRFYTESIQFMRSLLKTFPNGEMGDRAQFWIGECLFQQRNYDEAIKEYELVSNYKSSTKVDDAVYKTALCYYNLGENDISLERLKFLKYRYPASEYIADAMRMINQLSLDSLEGDIKNTVENEEPKLEETKAGVEVKKDKITEDIKKIVVVKDSVVEVDSSVVKSEKK